ncbi:MAG: CsbD family protein [Catenulispora sp.]
MEFVGRSKEETGKATGSRRLRVKGRAKRAHAKANRVAERSRDEIKDPTNKRRRYK